MRVTNTFIIGGHSERESSAMWRSVAFTLGPKATAPTVASPVCKPLELSHWWTKRHPFFFLTLTLRSITPYVFPSLDVFLHWIRALSLHLILIWPIDFSKWTAILWVLDCWTTSQTRGEIYVIKKWLPKNTQTWITWQSFPAFSGGCSCYLEKSFLWNFFGVGGNPAKTKTGGLDPQPAWGPRQSLSWPTWVPFLTSSVSSTRHPLASLRPIALNQIVLLNYHAKNLGPIPV